VASGNRITRQRAIAELAGWVASNISLSKNRRLEAVLDTGEGTPFQNLLQELPAATVVEWDDGRQPERFPNFVNLVTRRLEVEGSQAVLLRTRDKLADTSSEDATEHVSDEHALEAFHLREELYAIESAAGLSQQEHQVIELLLRDYKQCDIADTLGVTEGTVKTVKYRAVKKLKRAAGH
jgi:RNA polymerase sigma factor (sigma-70 family)